MLHPDLVADLVRMEQARRLAGADHRRNVVAHATMEPANGHRPMRRRAMRPAGTADVPNPRAAPGCAG